MKPRLFVALAIGTIVATNWYACGGSGGSSSSTPTSPSGSTTNSATMFEGTIAGAGGQSGAFSVTIQTTVAASSVASLRAAGLTIKPESFTEVSGTLNVAGGASVTLAGAYDSSTNTVTLSGSGFAFTGTISSGVLSGTYTGPNGSSGGFSGLNATQTSVTAYCGTYQEPSNSGVFNIDIAATGAASGATSDGCLVTGQLSGNTLTLFCPSKVDGGGGNGARGTVQNGTASGTISTGGTFTGTTAACSIPAPPPAASGVAFNIGFTAGPGSFAADLQNQTLMASDVYNFILPPGVYTLSGHVLGVGGPISGLTQGGLSIHFTGTVTDAKCNTAVCAGVAPVLQSSITGGVGNGTQSVNSCAVNYNTGNPNNCQPASGGGPSICPTPSLDFQLQFTVTASGSVCQ